MSNSVDTQIQLHAQSLCSLEKRFTEHIEIGAREFEELKTLLSEIHTGSTQAGEKMFKVFDARLVELKTDFKEHYQTKAAAEHESAKVTGLTSSLRTVKVMILGAFSVVGIVIAIIELVKG